MGRAAIAGVIFCLMLLGFAAYYLNAVATRCGEIADRLDHAIVEIESLQKATVLNSQKIEDVKTTTDTLVEDKASQPDVKLVAETDPKKAAKTPVKVRIARPKTTPSASASPSIEIPLPLNSAQVTEKK